MVPYFSANFIFHTYESKFCGIEKWYAGLKSSTPGLKSSTPGPKSGSRDRKVGDAGIEKWVAEIIILE